MIPFIAGVIRYHRVREEQITNSDTKRHIAILERTVYILLDLLLINKLHFHCHHDTNMHNKYLYHFIYTCYAFTHGIG